MITSFEPHLHAPGARMCLEAIWGFNIETLTCSGYDHNWVRGYDYADDSAPILPKGTILHIIGYMDNSKANKNVPDLNKRELGMLLALVAVMVWIGVYPATLFDMIEEPVNYIVRKVDPTYFDKSEQLAAARGERKTASGERKAAAPSALAGGGAAPSSPLAATQSPLATAVVAK